MGGPDKVWGPKDFEMRVQDVRTAFENKINLAFRVELSQTVACQGVGKCLATL